MSMNVRVCEWSWYVSSPGALVAIEDVDGRG